MSEDNIIYLAAGAAVAVGAATMVAIALLRSSKGRNLPVEEIEARRVRSRLEQCVSIGDMVRLYAAGGRYQNATGNDVPAAEVGTGSIHFSPAFTMYRDAAGFEDLVSSYLRHVEDQGRSLGADAFALGEQGWERRVVVFPVTYLKRQ